MPTIPVNGTDLYYRESGSGPALLFIHGMCGFADVWEDQIHRLSPDFRCVAYDRRGHTRSPLGQVERRTVELHADDAAALIQALDLAPCVLVTSSGGARIGLDVVRRYPHLLAGAVLSEPPALALAPEGAPAFIAELRPLIERAVASGGVAKHSSGAASEAGAERGHAVGPRAAVDAFFDHLCPGLWRRIDDARRDRYRDNHAELFGDLQMPPYQVSIADLAAIAVPCRVIRGDSSHPLFREITQVLADHIPGADLVELPSSGHVTYAEQPAAFAEAVRVFAHRLAPQPVIA